MQTSSNIPQIKKPIKFLTILDLECFMEHDGKIAVIGKHTGNGTMDAATFFNNWLPRMVATIPKIFAKQTEYRGERVEKLA